MPLKSPPWDADGSARMATIAENDQSRVERPDSAAAETRRRNARVRLLRDLVSHGLYRVDNDLLADRLMAAFTSSGDGR